MTDRDCFTATELARILKVPVGTIHRWAHEDDWPRQWMRGTTRYAMRAAQASYDARGRGRRDTLRRASLTSLR